MMVSRGLAPPSLISEEVAEPVRGFQGGQGMGRSAQRLRQRRLRAEFLLTVPLGSHSNGTS